MGAAAGHRRGLQGYCDSNNGSLANAASAATSWVEDNWEYIAAGALIVGAAAGRILTRVSDSWIRMHNTCTDDFLPGLPDSAPPQLGRGSTGRIGHADLQEQLAVTSVRANPDGAPIRRIAMSDPRWPAEDGWAKMQQIETGVNVHYVENTVTDEADDFKFK